ncbi:MAG: hypothetical protein GX763_09640 [Clostridiaceae bacterium]|nr:hypothetical protein [Clostridiaceae bacterium]
MQEQKLTEQDYMKLMLEIHSNLINIQSIADRIRKSGGWAFPKVIRLRAQQLLPEVYLISSETLAADKDPFNWRMPSIAKPYKVGHSTGLEFSIGSVRFYDQHNFKEDKQ